MRGRGVLRAQAPDPREDGERLGLGGGFLEVLVTRWPLKAQFSEPRAPFPVSVIVLSVSHGQSDSGALQPLTAALRHF